MKRITLLAAAAVLALASAASAAQAPTFVRGAQTAPTQCQPDTAECSVVLSRWISY